MTKFYGKTKANDDLNFSVMPGEICVLAGPNGAGKSTAIKCVLGLLRFSGDVRIGGHPNGTLEAKRMLGYVPEMPALYELLTVGEHLEFIARAYKLDDSWHGRAQALLERLELADKQKKLSKELSKGMQQKVSIACALLHEPAVLLLDEPMVGLDPHAIKELKAILSERRAAGCAVVVSTHMLDSVEDLWDQMLILMQGRVARSLRRADTNAMDESLEEMFFRVTENGGAA